VAEIETGAFREAMGQMPTAVTVVTAMTPRGRSGATASAVGGLSLDPMLVLVCLDRNSRTLRSVQEAGSFGINVLASDQEPVARQFATKRDEEGKWEGIDSSVHDGIPALWGVVLWVGCELQDVLMGGDHVILTGAVTDLEANKGQPLIHHRGKYRGLD
jgi:flavin reductase (DIM6/NTAB) family NADH-FMN oxidoreductase RutF